MSTAGPEFRDFLARLAAAVWPRERPVDPGAEMMAAWHAAGTPGLPPAPGDERGARARAWLERMLGFLPEPWALIGTARIAAVDGDPPAWQPWAIDDPAGTLGVGCPAVVIPALAGDQAIDLVAVPATAEARAALGPWFLRTGAAEALGWPAGAARDAWERGEAVRLNRDPWTWLQLNRGRRWPESVCILGEPDDVTLAAILNEVAVVCDDDDHAAAIVARRERHLRAARRARLGRLDGKYHTIQVATA